LKQKVEPKIQAGQTTCFRSPVREHCPWPARHLLAGTALG
jgi:hypothetical protein